MAHKQGAPSTQDSDLTVEVQAVVDSGESMVFELEGEQFEVQRVTICFALAAVIPSNVLGCGSSGRFRGAGFLNIHPSNASWSGVVGVESPSLPKPQQFQSWISQPKYFFLLRQNGAWAKHCRS